MAEPSSLDEGRRLIEFACSLGATREEAEAAWRAGEVGVLCIELATRPEGALVDFEEAVADSGIPLDVAAGLWRGLGFPDPRLTPTRLTPPELRSLELLATISRDVLGPEQSAEMARVVGGALARVSEALVDAFRIAFEVPKLQQQGVPYADVVEQYVVLARDLFPRFEETLGAVMRRHVIGVSVQVWATDEEGSTITVNRTVGFADLVGYTAATSQWSASQLAGAVGDFEGRVADVLSEHGGRLVKMIGDEAMFVLDDPGTAAGVAAELIDAFGDQIRVGLASGALVSIRGDYYGEVVNLAARLTQVSDPGTALLSEPLARLAPDGAGLSLVGPLTLKGFGDPVDAWVLRP